VLKDLSLMNPPISLLGIRSYLDQHQYKIILPQDPLNNRRVPKRLVIHIGSIQVEYLKFLSQIFILPFQHNTYKIKLVFNVVKEEFQGINNPPNMPSASRVLKTQFGRRGVKTSISLNSKAIFSCKSKISYLY